MKKYKPVIRDAHIIDIVPSAKDLFENMFELTCGKCGQCFGLSTGDKKDTAYFENNYNFCNKCGAPVDWSKEENK